MVHLLKWSYWTHNLEIRYGILHSKTAYSVLWEKSEHKLNKCHHLFMIEDVYCVSLDHNSATTTEISHFAPDSKWWIVPMRQIAVVSLHFILLTAPDSFRWDERNMSGMRWAQSGLCEWLNRASRKDSNLTF